MDRIELRIGELPLSRKLKNLRAGLKGPDAALRFGIIAERLRASTPPELVDVPEGWEPSMPVPAVKPTVRARPPADPEKAERVSISHPYGMIAKRLATKRPDGAFHPDGTVTFFK